VKRFAFCFLGLFEESDVRQLAKGRLRHISIRKIKKKSIFWQLHGAPLLEFGR